MQKFALIVAAGSGKRMNSEIPKQFLEINGKPVLMHTLNRFFEYNSALRILVILKENDQAQWQSLVNKFSFKIPHSIVVGGETRFHSVKNGLNEIETDGLIAIHDGVRPMCTPSLIDRCFKEAEKFSNAIPFIPVTESLRESDGNSNRIINRNKIMIIQTPQCFKLSLIRKAYQQQYTEKFTDDASVFETDGHTINLVPGEKTNIKITEPADLKFAEAFLI